MKNVIQEVCCGCGGLYLLSESLVITLYNFKSSTNIAYFECCIQRCYSRKVGIKGAHSVPKMSLKYIPQSTSLAIRNLKLVLPKTLEKSL